VNKHSFVQVCDATGVDGYTNSW